MAFVPDQPSGCIDPATNALRVNVIAGGVLGGGGPVTIIDGGDVAQGATTDVAVTSDVNGTISAKLRGFVKILASVWDSINGRLKVDGSGVTQPISAASLPLPTGAALDSSLTTIDTDLKATQPRSVTNFPAGFNVNNQPTVNQGNAGVQKWLVDGSGVTQPISAVSLPLPTGAALDSSLATLDADLKVSQPRAVTQTTSPWVIQPVDEQGNKIQASEQHALLQAIYMEMKAMRLGMERLVAELDDRGGLSLIETAQEYDEEVIN
jgi:hypothetical protein